MRPPPPAYTVPASELGATARRGQIRQPLLPDRRHGQSADDGVLCSCVAFTMSLLVLMPGYLTIRASASTLILR